jgi:aryl-alcohol dehydrogenase-like predicted oxidoreductase
MLHDEGVCVEYAKLGNTGLDVSRICLGCMGFGDAERWVHKWVLDEELDLSGRGTRDAAALPGGGDRSDSV